MTHKLATLTEAVRAHVRPRMYLNFASTPSRSNAAIREVARAFRGRDPQFVLSATGFHSSAHLLAMLRLGRRYVACYFGDNYPVPRPNELYSQILREGAEVQPWSVGTYIAALRAGALGLDFATTRSLRGTTMGDELRAAGMYREVPMAGERGTAGLGEAVGLVSALRADVTFVHALMGDEDGNLVFSAPHGEGFWSAIGARVGVIATVEQIVGRDEIRRHVDAIMIPPHRVIAVCESRFGAHPQPLFALPRFGVRGYPDDFDHYELWREMASDPSATEFRRFTACVLENADPASGYREFVGSERLVQLSVASANLPPDVATHPSAPPSRPPPPLDARAAQIAHAPDAQIHANEIQLVLAARKIVERVGACGYQTILAGVGQGFLAVRLAKLWLLERGIDVKVLVELGLYDMECGTSAHEFPLAYDNLAHAARLTSADDVLAAIACGADNACLAVIGAAQIDPSGAVNSTRLGRDRFLVGSGGANDVASCAAEVLVLTRCTRTRLVSEVDYITSPGRAVRNVVTDRCCFARDDTDGRAWKLTDVYPALGGRPIADALAAIRDACDWEYETPTAHEYAPAISTAEIRAIHTLDPRGVHWRRGQ